MSRYSAAMSAALELPDQTWIRRFRRAVLRWYRHSGRDLPWRDERDPYRVWVREIMLQQTTVAAVVPYLERFLAALPTLETLADASEQDVLRLWEGLGYYSRARNLRKAAQTIVADFEGAMPVSVEAIQSLSGIGRYTAGAIASFAFGQQAAIVEANTARFYARLIGLDEELSKSSSQKRLWAFADAVVPAKEPGKFNQALIDLGATVCRPKEPLCSECAVASLCKAFQTNRVGEIPAPKKRSVPTQLVEACVAVERRNEVLLQQRDETEWWSGLWDFPRFRESEGGTMTDDQRRTWLAKAVREQSGLEIKTANYVKTMTHAVTRYQITLHCYRAQVIAGRKQSKRRLKWVPITKLREMPLTKTARRFANRLYDEQRNA